MAINSARKVAIVEDDFDQRENYRDALQQSGYEVTTYPNRPEALQGMKKDMPDLAILDIMLENEMDGGFDLCRDLRALSPTLPIIFLTARDSDIDRVSGLRLDAWDYLTKPLNMQFLSVRINSLFRIVDSLNKTSEDTDSDALVIDDLSINEDSMSIKWKDQELSLTLTEFWLIESMARHPGHVKTYENMMQITRQSYVERNTINGYIRRIRNKFKEIDSEFKQIQTVFGVGYKWNSEG
ncbi:proteobacterial dedicated sortase system response regulator [Arenicella sp. 4NH20-0111]|uniref:response regulator n=1 Tax=Arenicella sp. 4NH20-0111 TaxID=3127648 RepID=UPI00310824BF